MARVVVLGIGNVLNSDHGLGPFVARNPPGRLGPRPETPRCSTPVPPGWTSISLLDDADAAIFVDAVRAQGAPGDVDALTHRVEILEGRDQDLR